MSNKKSLFYGLGSGMIAGAVLLQLMLAAPSSGTLTPEGLGETQPGTAAETMTPERLKEAASVYYQVYEKDVKVYLQPQVEELIGQRLAEEKKKQEAAAPVKEIYIYVQSGLALWQVSDMLVQSGLIADKKAFEDEMRKRQLTGSIIAGAHEFKGPQTLDQIITGLTVK
ncbi:hypothetical protein SAMN02799630_01572 [Paenibacillus sp. UNCCL117]|uniref:hypothetical protein n=1 Tax=unclassified Paenibacillus TaxID=185978 RepID=UPI00088F7DC8|nr:MULTISPECIES: hypothetical protein [unclassified Paenibacillus]SDC87145.1 hypothetical protein SAMN04488602_10457 [Paenibacillus sp. cl123]SFW27990.1 hypothetical protein SAMN02799630_01572 [Paenibacillus sp. UNCCL117]